MGCGIYWDQIHELERALGVMERYGVPSTSEAYQSLYSRKGALLARVGEKSPRSYDWLRFLTGESPGTIRLAHDIETGFFVEAREKPGAPPIYHRVSDEEAMAILKQQVSPELHKKVFTPDEYYGE